MGLAMRKLVLGMLLVPFLWAAAYAQGVPTSATVAASCGTPPTTYAPGQNKSLLQDTNGQLCSSTVLTTSGTQNTNLTQINGNTVSSGAGASGTGTQQVITSTDSTIGAVTSITNALPAGTNLIGKFGIDQTTPGTTNGVSQNASTPVSTTLQSTATANGNGTNLNTNGMASAVLTVNCATCSGGTTVNFEGTEDGTNYTPVSFGPIGGSATSTTTTTAGLTYWQTAVAGLQNIRARISGYSAGTITVTGHAVPVEGATRLSASNTNITQFGGVTISTGTGASGTGIPRVTVSNDSSLAANQSMNESQINAVTPLMGNGVTGTGSQRVTIASDNTAFSVKDGDGTNSVTVKAASTSPALTDTSLVVATSPNPAPVCTGVTAISQTTSTDVKTFTNFGYICSVILFSATAQSISVIEGTGTVCATNTAALIGGTSASLALAINGSFSAVAGMPWLKTQTTAHHLCVLQSSTGNVSGIITWQDHT